MMKIERCEEEVFLEKLMRSWENSPELELLGAESTPCCNLGDNYMSTITRVRLSLNKGGRKVKESVLLKRPPSSQARCEAFRCDPAFRNEAAAYSKVVPVLSKFANIHLPFPACLHASSSLIVLEDLKPRGYAMADRLTGLSVQQATLALQALGRFHGTSLALRHEEPEEFEKAVSKISELIFVGEANQMFSSALESSHSMAVGVLERTPGLSQAASRLNSLKGSLFEIMSKLVQPNKNLSTVCHGDFWINNMLFKYSTSGVPTSVMLLDLQVVRYGPMITDVLHLLYTSLEPGVRRRSEDQLVKAYHESLEATLKELAPSAPRPSLDDLKRDMDEKSLYGLIIGLLLLPAITATSVPNLDEAITGQDFDPEFLERTYSSLPPTYTNRLIELVMDFVDRNFI